MRRWTSASELDESESEVNLTPMLDVVFIMLIFFIVTATFIKEEGLDINQPDNNEQAYIDDKKVIGVKITSGDRIVIAQREVDWRAVRPVIERLHAQNPEAPVVVRPHARSRTETMVHVMDMARLAGVHKVSLGVN